MPKKAAPLTAISPDRDALLLAKYQAAPYVGWSYGPRDSTNHALVSEHLKRLADAGLIVAAAPYMKYHSPDLTDAGKALAETAQAHDLVRLAPTAKGNDRAQSTLWFWLLINGGVKGTYGSDDLYGPQGEIVHLFACGLDLKTSSSVDDDVWTVWAGTFADDQRETGVGGTATCFCGEVSGLSVSAKVESITDLLKQVLGLG